MNREIPPRYLGFLDRELTTAAGCTPDPRFIEASIQTLLLSSSAPLYAGLSIVVENAVLATDQLRLLEDLAQSGALELVSSHPRLDEFVESRRILYAHDRARYPVYFDPHGDRRLPEGLRPTRSTRVDTTERLAKRLRALIEGNDPVAAAAGLGSLEPQVRKELLEALDRREGEAITTAFFAPLLKSRTAAALAVVQRMISYLYASHYLTEHGGEWPTGFPGLAVFDALLSERFPLVDLKLLRLVLGACGFGPVLNRRWGEERGWWQEALELRGTPEHLRVSNQIARLLDVLGGSEEFVGEDFEVRRRQIGAALKSCFGTTGPATTLRTFPEHLRRAEASLDGLAIDLRRQFPRMDRLKASFELDGSFQTDVLLLCVTKVEIEQILEAFGFARGDVPKSLFGKSVAAYDIGYFGGARVCLVRSEMGSGGSSGSTLTTSDAIGELNPATVIATGIAFGVDDKKQRIGDVLISTSIWDYEPQRVGRGRFRKKGKIERRGPEYPASDRVLDRFRLAEPAWNASDLHFGTIMSGAKLVDNLDFRNSLLQLAGRGVVGGEMEGAGISAAASRKKTDWIVVKSICDWADGHKGVQKAERQKVAASRSATFTRSVIERGGFNRAD